MKKRQQGGQTNNLLNFKGIGAWRSLEAHLNGVQGVWVSIANFPMISRGVSLENRKKRKFFNQNVTKNVTKDYLSFAPQVLPLPTRAVYKFQPPCVLGRNFFLACSILTILTAFFLNGCGHIQMFKDWDTQDTSMLAAELVLTFIDYRQTLNISDRIDEGYYEKYNSIGLGKHPSRGRINTWFLCSTTTKTLVAGLLPKNDNKKMYKRNSWLDILNRENWLVLNIGISAGMVSNNYDLELEVNF